MPPASAIGLHHLPVCGPPDSTSVTTSSFLTSPSSPWFVIAPRTEGAAQGGSPHGLWGRGRWLEGLSSVHRQGLG